jgi:hypothetical protein
MNTKGKKQSAASGFPDKHSFFLLILLLPLLTGCESDGNIIGSDIVKAGIRFEVAGAWAAQDPLAITEDGLVIKKLYLLPELMLQLSEKEHNGILDLFRNFDRLKDSYNEAPCEDDARYVVTYERLDGRRKTVSAWSCYITLNAETNPDMALLRKITAALTALSFRVYNEQAPWIGLEVSFEIARRVYSRDEPILFAYRILNPTQQARKLYFPYRNRYGFDVYGGGQRLFSYPEEIRQGTLDSLVIMPGEKVAFSHQLEPSLFLAKAPAETADFAIQMYLLTNAGHNTVYPIYVKIGN